MNRSKDGWCHSCLPLRLPVPLKVGSVCVLLYTVPMAPNSVCLSLESGSWTLVEARHGPCPCGGQPWDWWDGKGRAQQVEVGSVTVPGLRSLESGPKGPGSHSAPVVRTTLCPGVQGSPPSPEWPPRHQNYLP
jgi:hypothetical protein